MVLPHDSKLDFVLEVICRRKVSISSTRMHQWCNGLLFVCSCPRYSLKGGQATRQVECTNAFAQAKSLGRSLFGMS
jgi:hypothetical protein